ncbi:helix-turn-helix domain-containing protein [Limibacter armeniacum]|uniref:helix-turn-helix domain-containing protein n=1 Tax=Limibacter armeniacum TaxID=466084 RepID=UPI002FE6AA6C
MSHLNSSQRQKIQEGIRQGKSNAAIARELGVHRSTVGRELRRNGGDRESYDFRLAQRIATQTQRLASRLLRNPKGKGRRRGSSLMFQWDKNFVGSRYYFFDPRRRFLRKRYDEKISRWGELWKGNVWRWDKTDRRWGRRRWRYSSLIEMQSILETYTVEKKCEQEVKSVGVEVKQDFSFPYIGSKETCVWMFLNRASAVQSDCKIA